VNIFCGTCGEKLAPDTTFCGSCGAGAAGPTPAAPSPIRKRSVKRVVLIAVGVAIAGKVGYDAVWGWDHAAEIIQSAGASPTTSSPKTSDVVAPTEATRGGSTEAYSPEIETVRNGTLTGYNSTIVGKALEGTFQNPKWISFETPMGATLVEFDGTIGLTTLEHAHFSPKLSEEQSQKCNAFPADGPDFHACSEAILVPVKFQFTLSTDKKHFVPTYLSGEEFSQIGPAGKYEDPAATLAFIYK
jgi:hypothetical protein